MTKGDSPRANRGLGREIVALRLVLAQKGSTDLLHGGWWHREC